MKISDPSHQFVKDGVVGVIVVLLVFVVFTCLLFGYLGMNNPNDLREYFDFLFFFPNFDWGGFFLSPMPIVLLTVFISVGISGWWLEKRTSRFLWIRDSFFLVVCSWLIGLVVFSLCFIPIAIVTSDQWLKISDYASFLEPVVRIGGISAFIGFIFGSVVGTIFNPSGRLSRIIVGTIASTCVGYGIGLSVLLPQIAQ